MLCKIEESERATRATGVCGHRHTCRGAVEAGGGWGPVHVVCGCAAPQMSPQVAANSAPCLPDLQGPLARRKKEKKNVLVDVTRRGGSGGWTAGGSDEDRCLLTPSTPTEFVFHRVLAEEAA